MFNKILQITTFKPFRLVLVKKSIVSLSTIMGGGQGFWARNLCNLPNDYICSPRNSHSPYEEHIQVVGDLPAASVICGLQVMTETILAAGSSYSCCQTDINKRVCYSKENG